MWTTLFRSLIWVGCAGLALTANACSSSGSGGDASATGGNATAGAGGAAGAGESSAGSTGAADAGPTDASQTNHYFFTFTGGADISAAAISNPSDTDKNDLGVFATDGGPRATASLDMTTGDPTAGSMELQLPSNAYGQFIDYQFILPVISDLGGKTLSVMIRLDSGFSPDPAAPGNVYLYAKSGDNWDWGQGSAQSIVSTTAGQWIKYTFPMATPASGSTAMFDPGYVKAVGIHLTTGTGAGASGPPAPAVFHIDSLGYE